MIRVCDSLDLLPVPFILGIRRSVPCIVYLPGHRLRGGPQAQCQYIRVIIDASALCGLRIATQSRTNAGDLICGNRRSGSSPAANNGLVGIAARHRIGRART